MSYAVIIDWFGPYSSVEAAKQEERNAPFGESLYLAIGSVKRRPAPQIQYIGITLDVEYRFDTKHTIRREINQEGLNLWVGVVSSQAVSGRKGAGLTRRHNTLVQLAEGVLIYFLQPPLNKDKRKRIQKDHSVMVYNRWWKADGETRRRQRPHPTWPDVIEYDTYTDIGVVAWLGGRKRYYNSDDLREIGEIAKRDLSK